MKQSEGKTSTRGRKRVSAAASDRVDRKLMGVRIEPRLVKVMKAVAELHDLALGELIERVFWASMEGGNFFAEKGKMTAETRRQLESLRSVYGVTYDQDFLTGGTTNSVRIKEK